MRGVSISVIFLILILGFVSSENFINLSFDGIDYNVELVSVTDTSATIKVTDSLGNSKIREISPEQDVFPYEINDIGGLKIILINANEQLVESKLEVTLWIGLDIYFCMSTCENTKTFVIDGNDYSVEFLTASDMSSTINLNGFSKEISPEQGGVINSITQSHNIDGLQVILVSADESPVEPMLESNITFYYEKNLSIVPEVELNETCVEDWSCTSWSDCLNNQQTRTCTDSNNCGTTENKPSISQSCGNETCVEDWSCTSWSNCINNKQTRECIDSNNCGTTENKPSEIKSCTSGTDDENNKTSENKTSTIQNRYYIKNQEVNIERNRISMGEYSVESNLDIVNEDSVVYVKTSKGNTEIKLLPEDAVANADKIENVRSIEIAQEEDVAVYVISGKKKARLFLIFPVTADVKQSIDVESGEVISIKKPWWSFLALGI